MERRAPGHRRLRVHKAGRPLLLRAVLLGIAAGLLILVTLSSARAYDRTFLADHLANFANCDNTYSQCTWAVTQWINWNRPLNWCSDDVSLYTAVINSWEQVHPQTQFLLNCSTPELRIAYGAGCSGAVGCFVPTWYSDGNSPAGYYLGGGTAWINTTQYAFDTLAARQSVAAHEVGHVYGLHERYLHDPSYSLPSIACSGTGSGQYEYTIMDSVSFSGPYRVSGHCDGSIIGPVSNDTARAQNFYSARPPWNLTTWKAGPWIVGFSWSDYNYAEDSYVGGYYHCTTSSCTSHHIEGSAIIWQVAKGPGDATYPLTLSWSWTIPPSHRIAGTYMICMATPSQFYASSVSLCSSIYMSGPSPE